MRVFLILLFCTSIASGAIHYRGTTGDYLTHTNNIKFAPEAGAWNLCFWLRVPADSANEKLFVPYFHYNGGGNQILMYWQPRRDAAGGSNMFFRARGDGGDESISDDIGTNYADGVWHHYAFTRPASGTGDWNFYIDGVSILTGARINANSINPGQPVEIGENVDAGGASMYGDIAGYLIVKGRELTKADIDNMLIGKWVSDDDTMCYYPMEEGAVNIGQDGATASDYSGNNLHLDDSGTLTYIDGPPILWNRGGE